MRAQSTDGTSSRTPPRTHHEVQEVQKVQKPHSRTRSRKSAPYRGAWTSWTSLDSETNGFWTSPTTLPRTSTPIKSNMQTPTHIKPNLPTFYMVPVSENKMRFICPRCGCPIRHGRGCDGHRESHCSCWPGGYYVKEAGPTSIEKLADGANRLSSLLAPAGPSEKPSSIATDPHLLVKDLPEHLKRSSMWPILQAQWLRRRRRNPRPWG